MHVNTREMSEASGSLKDNSMKAPDTLLQGDEVTMDSLRQARLIGENIKDVKIILAGEITRAMTVKGLKITKGAQAAVEAAGGKVEA